MLKRFSVLNQHWLNTWSGNTCLLTCEAEAVFVARMMMPIISVTGLNSLLLKKRTVAADAPMWANCLKKQYVQKEKVHGRKQARMI